MTAICVERSDTLLLPEQAEFPFGEVKKRTDTRVSLVVIVAEGTLIVAVEAGDPPVGDQGPVVAEALIEFNLHRLINALGILVRIRLSVRLEFSAEQRTVLRDELRD